MMNKKYGSSQYVFYCRDALFFCKILCIVHTFQWAIINLRASPLFISVFFSTRWACLRSIRRSQSLFRQRPNPSSFPASSRTQINERRLGTCSRICSCVKTSKAKRARSLSNPQVTSLTKSNMLSTAVIIMWPGLTLLVISMVCKAFWVCERAHMDNFSQANTQSCQTPP